MSPDPASLTFLTLYDNSEISSPCLFRISLNSFLVFFTYSGIIQYG
jgi:hypothetical protein